MLEDVREGKKPSLSGDDSAYFLHFGPILLNAVEFFSTLVVILSRVSLENLRGGTK